MVTEPSEASNPVVTEGAAVEIISPPIY